MEHLNEVLRKAMEFARTQPLPRGRVLTVEERKAIRESKNPEHTRARILAPFYPEFARELFGRLGSEAVTRGVEERLKGYGNRPLPSVFDVERLYLRLHETRHKFGTGKMEDSWEEEASKLF